LKDLFYAINENQKIFYLDIVIYDKKV